MTQDIDPTDQSPGVASRAVALCDWQSRVVWTSDPDPARPAGSMAVDYVPEPYRQRVQEAATAVLGLRKYHELDIVDHRGLHYRVCIWPIETEQIAACALATHVPAGLALLSHRERECLQLLAGGLSVSTIARQLSIAVSTVHTHFKRSREKLRLRSFEGLIRFASRYCAEPTCPLVPPTGAMSNGCASPPGVRAAAMPPAAEQQA